MSVTILFLASAESTMSQCYLQEDVVRPYEEHHGVFHLKVYIHFVTSPQNQWINQNAADSSAQISMSLLNDAFNKHGIFFVGGYDACGSENAHLIETQIMGLYTIRDLVSGAANSDGIDIYIFGNTGFISGWAYAIPNTFFEIRGSEGGIPANETTAFVHEMGHLLGLLHTFESNCNESLPCPGGQAPCHCTGDFICDTPVTTDSLMCGVDTMAMNYMSYADSWSCRNSFSTEQVKRMRAYLATSSTLANVVLEPVTYPNVNPSSPSGNIIVESGELVISATLEMLPGATIRVKPGATLRVQSTITGACGKMWQGIIVEGDAFDPIQSPNKQGRVIVEGSGKIEHARCAIDVQDPDAPGGGTGGGIVKTLTSARLENNLIGIRFGQYTYQNSSSLVAPIFSVTNDYRGGSERPTFLQLNAIKGLSIRSGRFWDLRAQCPAPSLRAIGIDARNAGFRVSLSSHFENLYIGIRADKLTETNGSLSVSGSNFTGCYKDIELLSSGSFSVFGNNFEVKKPDACPSLPIEVIGVQIRGETTGFLFSGNDFYFDGEGFPTETLVGTDCVNLKDGLGNTILDNKYFKMTIGNRASGNNGYDSDGLLYLCNTNKNHDGLADFRIIGSIRRVQGDMAPSTQLIRPTGNTFTADYTAHCTIENLGPEIAYYFYNGDTIQDPGIPDGSGFPCVLGFEREPVGQPNESCADPEPPCFPCPGTEVSEWATNFHQNRQQWLTKTAAFPLLTDSAQRAAAVDSIRQLRLAMNQDGSRVLMQYSLDTLNIEIDSITHWLGLLQTHQTDVRLARHHFFTGDYAAFDTLWGQIPVKHELSGDAEDEFERLGEVYDTLRAHLSVGTQLDKLPHPTLETLKTWTNNCDEAGFLSEAILWRNGIEYGPDCSEEEERPSISTSVPLGEKNELTIYPNPATNVLHVEYPMLAKQGRLRIFNLQGQTVSDIPLYEKSLRISVQVSHFTPGIYLIELHHGQGLPFRKKVVVSQ